MERNAQKVILEGKKGILRKIGLKANG